MDSNSKSYYSSCFLVSVLLLEVTLLLTPIEARSAVWSSDIFATYSKTNGEADPYVTSHHALLFGDSVRFGLAFLVNRQHKYQLEYAAGIGFVFGESFFLETDFLVMRREYKTGLGVSSGNAAVFMPAIGYRYRWLRFFIPITMRYFYEGDFKGETFVDSIPHIGVEFRL